jgi:hypothetical protein
MESLPPSLGDLASSLKDFLHENDNGSANSSDSSSSDVGMSNSRPVGLSTGPTSPSGKSSSRLNSMTHGLDATDDIFISSLNPRERQAYTKIRRSLRKFYSCADTSYELLLIDKMAIQHLRMLRLYRLESDAMETTTHVIDKSSIIPHLDRFSRYDVRIERQLRILHNRLLSVFNQNSSSSYKPFSNME